MSPEAIAAGYPDRSLADVHAILAYYFRHQPAMDEYLHQRQEAAQKLRQEIEAGQRRLSDEVRNRMNAFKAQREAARDKPPL